MLLRRKSRSISRRLPGLASVAESLGHGDFSKEAPVDGCGEISQVSKAINSMKKNLKKSYSELESQVQKRTAELAHAVRARDCFISMAAHELKTPVTSLTMLNELERRILLKSQSNVPAGKSHLEREEAGQTTRPINRRHARCVEATE